MFKEFLLAMASGLGFSTVSDRKMLSLEERERQVLFVQRENQRHDEWRRQQAELRRQEEEKNRLARQQVELCREQQELARQNEALARQRNAALARQQEMAQRSKRNISDLL